MCSVTDWERLQQMHRDIVTVAPPDATIIGSNEICACQAMVIPGRMLSVQGIPLEEIVELTAQVIQNLIGLL